VDDLLKTDVDQPSIGLILCRSKDQVVVEYALRGITKPMGISENTALQSHVQQLQSLEARLQTLEATLTQQP